MPYRDYFVPFLAAILLLGSAGGICRGAPVAIANHSFELPLLGAGASVTSNTVDNWQDLGATADNGVFKGASNGQLAAPTDGSQMAFMNDLTSAALVQTLATTYQTGLDYELKVDIAARATVAAGHGATLYLFRGSIATLADLTAANTVASFVVDSSNGFTADVFNTFTLTATAAQVAAVGGAGQPIGIAIRGRAGSGQNQDIDNVRLEATPAYDADGDTLPDTWELAQTGVTGLNDLTNVGSGTPPGTGTGDYDGDGLADVAEFSRGTSAGRADSDSDGPNDGSEVSGAQNPYQVGHVPANPPGGTPGAPTLPTDNDSDGDGILDGEEVVAGSDGFVTNPNSANTDGDGADDEAEVAAGTNPTVPDAPRVYTPLQLNFKKDYQIRNYFNSSVPVSGLDLTQDVLAGTAHPRIHRTSPGCTFTQNGTVLQISNPTTITQESLISLGKINNYTAIDLDLSGQTHTTGTATALLSLHQDRNNRILVSQRDIDSSNKAISLTIIKGGTTVLDQTLSADGIAAPYTLRMHLTGVYLNFLMVKDGGAPVHLASIDIGAHYDLRTQSLLDSFTLAAGARLASGESVSITRLENFLTSGTSQADPRVIHYEDGAPMVEGNTIWVAMTTRGYGPIPSSYQSIYSYDLVTKEWKIASVLAFDKGDGKLRQWCAGDVLFDRKDNKWKVFVVSHGDDHKIYYGESTADLRNGHHRIDASLMNYASNGNEEDPTVFYDEDAGKWRMAMCKSIGGGYQTVLFESASANGAWSQIGIYTPTSSTGILIQKIGGQRYVFLGRGASPCPMEVLSYPGMVKLGELNLDVKPVGHNVWPVIIPLPHAGGTKYHLLTFDRSGLFPGWSYGNLHWYEADEVAGDFREYAGNAINPARNYASWIGSYDVGTQTGFSDDPDGDRLRNGMEAFFGTIPGVSNGGLTELSMVANTLTFRHPNPNIPISDVTGSYEWSPDMNTWYAADGLMGDGNTTVTTMATPDNPTANTTTVVATLVGTVPSRIFMRVAARTP